MHGHHIVYKNGGTRGSAGLAATKEAKDILLYCGINPYWDSENLIYAPNLGHPAGTIEFIRNQMKAKFDNNQRTKADMAGVLMTMGTRYFNVDLPGLRDPRS